MTLHEKLDLLIGFVEQGGDITVPEYYDIWSAGLCVGFVLYKWLSNSDEARMGFSYNETGCTLSATCDYYDTAYGSLMYNKSIDLTKINTIELMYTTSGSADFCGLAVDKSAEIKPSSSDMSTYERYTPNTSVGNTDVRQLLLDVSDLSGKYYVYVGLKQTSGNSARSGSIKIQSIHGLY